MDDLIKNTLEKIEKEHIKPYSKKYFYLKYSFFVLISVLFLVFSIISISLIFYLINDLDWDIYQHLNHSVFEAILIAIPHFWILILLLTSFATYKFFRKVKYSYRFNYSLIISFFFILLILGGYFLYKSDISYKLDQIFQKNIPEYRVLIHNMEDQWMQVDKGLLAGTIISYENNLIILEDLNGKIWNLELSTNTIIKKRVVLKNNFKIKIIGKKIDKDKFLAYEIRPWCGRRNIKCNDENFLK